jgi:hypothetical protein
VDDWVTLLPQNLQGSAYRSSLEWAWAREDAVRVLEILSERGYRVLGIDIWLATTPGPTIPTPFVYDWDAQRYPTQAIEFVKTFAWDTADESHGGREPYFNILAERPEH